MWKTKYLQFFSEVVCNQDNVPLLINHGIIQEKTRKHGISTQRLVDLAIVVKFFLKKYKCDSKGWTIHSLNIIYIYNQYNLTYWIIFIINKIIPSSMFPTKYMTVSGGMHLNKKKFSYFQIFWLTDF